MRLTILAFVAILAASCTRPEPSTYIRFVNNLGDLSSIRDITLTDYTTRPWHVGLTMRDTSFSIATEPYSGTLNIEAMCLLPPYQTYTRLTWALPVDIKQGDTYICTLMRP